MSVKDQVTRELEQLNDAELQQIADYIAFLKFRARRSTTRTLPNAAQLAQLYHEAAEEDRHLAETGMTEYLPALQSEDPT